MKDGPHERCLSGRLSAGCCSPGQEDERESRSDRQRGRNRIGRAERWNHGSHKTAGSNPGAHNQHRTVTESIIYFRTLDLSLRFLGRYAREDSLKNHKAPQDLREQVAAPSIISCVKRTVSSWLGARRKRVSSR